MKCFCNIVGCLASFSENDCKYNKPALWIFAEFWYRPVDVVDVVYDSVSTFL